MDQNPGFQMGLNFIFKKNVKAFEHDHYHTAVKGGSIFILLLNNVFN